MRITIREWLKDKRACRHLIIGFIVQCLYTIINARIVLMITDVIEHYEAYGPYLMKLMGACVIQIIFMSIISLMRGWSRHELYTTLNDQYEDKILNADYEMFTKLSCSRIVTASEQIWKITAVGGQGTQFILQFVNIITLIVSIYLIVPEIAIPIVIVYGVGFGLIAWTYRIMMKKDNAADETRRHRNQEMDETINGFAEVRGFCTEARHGKSIHSMNAKILKMHKSKQVANMELNAVIQIIDTVGTGLILLYAVSKISSGSLNMATGMALVMYVWRIIDPLIMIAEYADELSTNLSQINEYDKVVSYQNRTMDSGTTSLEAFDNEIVMENVGFGYEDSGSVVNGLNLTIKKGQRIGICGVSGGGKTTIFKLLTKFYTPDVGQILIDGIPYGEIDGISLRHHMGIVHQETHIFTGSIMDNIIYASPHASEYDIIDACKKANIYDFIKNLPEKFDTKVGPKGLKLSGGQKQRIALARIFLKDPEIILLDEATSALDNESETLIQDSLNKIEGKTIISIAHRLSTIKESDVIYVIGDHKVVEQGTHEELLNQRGVYFELNK